MSQNSPPFPTKFSIWGYLFLLPIFCYFYVLITYWYNFPFYDDYNVELKFLLDYQSASTFFEKLKIIFAQHNEHRVATIRLLTLLDFNLRGHLNFLDLILIGNLSLVVVVWVLTTQNPLPTTHNSRPTTKDSRLKTLYPLLITILIFSFQSWDNQFWALASVQNFGIYALVTLAIHFLVRHKLLFYLLFSLLAIATSGSGIVIIPVVLGFLILEKRWKELVISSVVLGLSLSLYFYQFQPSKQGISILNRILDGQIFEIIAFFFGFLGSNFYHPSVSFLAPVVGFVGFVWVIYLTNRKYYNSNPTIYLILIFLIITAGLAALGRSEKGIESAFPSRYRISSSIFIATCLISMLEIIPQRFKKWAFGISFVITITLYVLSIYFYLPRIKKNQELRMVDVWLVQHNMGVMGHFDTNFATPIIKKSIQSQIFELPKEQILSKKIDFTNSVITNLDSNFTVDWIKETNTTIAVLGWVKPAFKGKTVLLSINDSTAFQSLFVKRYDLVAKYNSLQYQDNGVFFVIPKDNWNKQKFPKRIIFK